MGKFWRIVAASSILGIGTLILAFAMSADDAANRDFIAYWAAGKQLIHHADPYDVPTVLTLERNAGLPGPRPFIMRNPPFALFITLPLAPFSVRTGAILWSFAIVAALMVSIRLIWRMLGSPADRLHFAGYGFPPVLACLLAGQVGAFLLLGVVLFLRLRETRPFAAGAALLLCALKPLLFLPFAAVIFCWIIVHRSFRLLAGFAAALAAGLALAYLLDPGAWPAYLRMVQTARLQNEFIPTVSLVFRLAIHRDWLWLQLAPTFAATVWALLYFRRRTWDWMENGMLVLLVSILAAPYAWFTDESVLLPAVLFSLYRTSENRRSLIPYLCIAGLALLEVFVGVPLTSAFYLWTAPAWLLWFVYAVTYQPAAAAVPFAR
jgi:hypothetical protein